MVTKIELISNIYQQKVQGLVNNFLETLEEQKAEFPYKIIDIKLAQSGEDVEEVVHTVMIVYMIRDKTLPPDEGGLFK